MQPAVGSGVSWGMRIPVLTRMLPAALLLAVCFAAATPLAAQPTRADSAAVLLATAIAFESEGERGVAEELYRHITEHFAGTPAADSALARLDRQLGAGGEIELRVWATTYGLWTGVAVPIAFDADGPEPYGVGLLVGGPAGYLAAHRFVGSRAVSPGQARAITWGGTWGAIQGAGWAQALDLGEDSGETPQAQVASMIAGGAIGIGAGLLASRHEITPGTATSAMAGSLWGLWFGVATAVLMDMDEDPTITTAMLFGNAGLLAGTLAGSRLPLSRGRARLISVGGLIGGFGGLGLALIGNVDNEKTAIALPFIGSVAGLIAGGALTRGDDVREDPFDASSAGPAPGALINWTGGALSLSTPLPIPWRDPAVRMEGRSGLAWKVPLVNVRF